MIKALVRGAGRVCIAVIFWLAVLMAIDSIRPLQEIGGEGKQWWLDSCIKHVKLLRFHCTDPDLQDVLDYTIRRYSRIGPYDVAIIPVIDREAIAYNTPWCPGIVLDPEILFWGRHEAAMVIVHEALHDYPPCLGHAHVYPRMEKLEELWQSMGCPY